MGTDVETKLARQTKRPLAANYSACALPDKLAAVPMDRRRPPGRELNVRYALEGSVQRSGNRLRVNVQLIDTENGQHLWAERFEKAIADLFDMQDEIVSRLANTLDAQLIAIRSTKSGAFAASRCNRPELSRSACTWGQIPST